MPAAPVARRSAVEASWGRCVAAGLEVDQPAPRQRESTETDPRLVWAAGPVLALLEATLAEEPVGILLCGADGTIVRAHGADRGVRRAMDGVHLAPGCSTAEEVVGTNGMGMALRDRRSWLMTGPEHFWERLRGFTCAGVPIRDASSGRLTGGLALATPSADHGRLLLALAGQTAANIATRLRDAPAQDDGPDGCGCGFGEHDRRLSVGACRPRLTRLEELEQQAIAEALRHHPDVESAAAHLGLSRATVYRRIRRYRLRPDGREVTSGDGP